MEKRIRKSSIEAYNFLKDNDLLGEKQFKVYDILFDKGPLTANEINQFFGNANIVNKNIHARLVELRDYGLVEEIDTRECCITKRIVIEWDVTDRKTPIRKKIILTKQIKEIDKKIIKLQEKRQKLMRQLNQNLELFS